MHEIQRTQLAAPKRFAPTDWLSAGLAFALMVMLFPTPQPRMISNQPWRAELLTTIVLIGAMVWAYWHDRRSLVQMFSIDDPNLKWVVRLIAAFSGWSLVSGLWSGAPFSAWHHTLVWLEYILFFLFAYHRLAADRNIRFISFTFLWIAGIIGILCLIDFATLPDFKALEGIIRGRYARYAELLITALPMVWVAAIYTGKRNSYLLMITVGALGWAAVMLSLSKGAFLAGAAGFCIMFAGILVLGHQGFRRRTLITLCIWACLTVGVQATFSLLTPVPATVDYISGKADATRETSLARVFMWNVGLRMASDNMPFGVGADNFGVAFNSSRATYRVQHPNEPKDEINADYLVQRAHNEVIQIAAELGLPGVLLLLAAALFFLAGLIRHLAATRYRVSPMLAAAVGGLAAFAASSMVSSFSFRLVQNGIVFFLVFAVAAYELKKTCRTVSKTAREPRRIELALIGCLLCVMLATSSLKAAAEYCVMAADATPDMTDAQLLYRRAQRLDPDYTAALLLSSARSYGAKDFASAADELRRSIDGGMGVIMTYSALTNCFDDAGDPSAADNVFIEALGIFPRSVFLRVRYSLFLASQGRQSESEAQMTTALNVDPSQANGWRNIIEHGSVAAYYSAQSQPNVAAPAELIPAPAVLEYLDDSPGDQP